MTQAFDPNTLQFYLTIPSPCPYLPDRMERKIFTQLDPISGPHLNNYLTHAGFRRSQNVIYRPACEQCHECRSMRIAVETFATRKSFKRILSKNSDITRTVSESFATNEQFDLLHRYLTSRHMGGGMSDMDFIRYEMMVENSATHSEIVEYRTPDHTLIACVLIDVLSDGFSMIYSFFDPELSGRSLGNFMILDHIQRCKEIYLPYLYLGYWVKGSPKMHYKAKFSPCEILGKNGWHRLDINE